MAQLRTYREKRDFTKTANPRGRVARWRATTLRLAPRFGTLSAPRTFPCDQGKARPMTMKRTRFVSDAKLDPGRFYRNPSDIIRDRRLTNEDRLEIVSAWERDTRQRLETAGAPEGADDKLSQLQRLREELELSLESAGEPREQD
jgi:hypothetical protein